MIAKYSVIAVPVTDEDADDFVYHNTGDFQEAIRVYLSRLEVYVSDNTLADVFIYDEEKERVVFGAPAKDANLEER